MQKLSHFVYGTNYILSLVKVAERRWRAASRMPRVHISASQVEMKRLRRATTTFSWALPVDEWW